MIETIRQLVIENAPLLMLLVPALIVAVGVLERGD